MSSPSDTVTKSSLQFIKVTERFNTEKPYEIWASEYSSFPRTNCTFHTVGDVPIEDVRNLKTKPSLHLNGFEYISDPIQLPSSNIDETAKICINAALSLVEQKLNAQSVVCYDWRYRSAEQKPADESSGTFNDNYEAGVRTGPLRPAYIVHIDESFKGGLELAIRVLGEESLTKYLTEGLSVSLVNVWRPIVPIVQNNPLTFCDMKSLDPEDIVICDKVHIDKVKEGIYVAWSPSQQWFWLSKQTPNEVSLFKTWDSTAGGNISGCAHGSFEIPLVKATSPRESIEVRIVAVHTRNFDQDINGDVENMVV